MYRMELTCSPMRYHYAPAAPKKVQEKETEREREEEEKERDCPRSSIHHSVDVQVTAN